MAQSSGPISQGTTSERQFTDVMWRDLFGDEAGVVGDMNGTAYNLVLSSGSDVAQIGSTNQLSTAKVGGFGHRIPAGSPEGITIPVASGGARTDIISLRYDPAFTGLPGPVRLTRIAGSSSSLPVYDDAPPGVEDLPLWSITRSPGQNLSQATVQRLFPRLAPTLDLPTGAPLPINSPLGTIARQGTSRYRRQLDNSNIPVWVIEAAESYFAQGTGGGAISTTATSPTSVGSVTVPAGTWDVDYRCEYSYSITTPRTFRTYLFAGTANVGTAVSTESTLSTVLAGEATGFERVTTTGPATVLTIKMAVTANGGTMNSGFNAIRARRVN